MAAKNRLLTSERELSTVLQDRCPLLKPKLLANPDFVEDIAN